MWRRVPEPRSALVWSEGGGLVPSASSTSVGRVACSAERIESVPLDADDPSSLRQKGFRLVLVPFPLPRRRFFSKEPGAPCASVAIRHSLMVLRGRQNEREP